MSYLYILQEFLCKNRLLVFFYFFGYLGKLSHYGTYKIFAGLDLKYGIYVHAKGTKIY